MRKKRFMIKKIIKSSIALMLGVLMGFLSKSCDVSSITIFYYFGIMTSGVLIWLVLGTFILIKSNNRSEFNFLYLLFMVGMMVSYYLYSLFVVKYINNKVILFWIIMLLISLIIGNIFYVKRNTNLFKLMYCFGAIIFIVFDAFFINGFLFSVIIPEIILAICMFLILRK